MSILRPVLLAAGLALVAAAPASAITALPTVSRTLAATRSSASCATGATASTTYVAPMAGFVTARLNAAGGEWDLFAADARSRRTVGQSRAFGSNEVLQTWVDAGQRLLLTGCRTAGRVSKATVSVELLDAARPANVHQSLVRTKPLDRATLGKLEGLGFDSSESRYRGYTNLQTPSTTSLKVLDRLGIGYKTVVPDLQAYDRRMLASDARRAALGVASPLPSGRSTYRFLSDYQTEMAQIVKDNPGIARPVTIGTTYQGRAIQGVELSKDVGANDDGKPTYFLMAVHHAREWPAGEIAMEFMTLLANEYGKSDADGVKVTDLLSKERIVIVPLINVDGFVASRGEWAGQAQTGSAIPDPEDQTIGETAEPVAGGGVFAYRRKNCDAFVPAAAISNDQARSFPCYYQLGVDPNRNYGFDWGGPGASNDPTTQVYRGDGQWSEPETQAVWRYSQTHPVTALVTLHTVASLVLRSPGLKSHGLAPDESLLKELGDKMAKSTGYTSEYGWQLYDTTGTTEDWNYGAAGTLGYTIELGDSSGNDVFHDAYQNGVIDQWTGKKGTRLLGGMHDALLTAADYAAQPKTHVILNGKGPAGATLELKKSFKTASSQICTVAQGYTSGNNTPGGCVAPGAVFGQTQADDGLDYKTVIPASGSFAWHVTQSTRPFVGYTYDAATKQPKANGTKESWTLTCSVGGTVVKTTSDIVVERGEIRDLGNPCS